jgi:exonuclease SbcD
LRILHTSDWHLGHQLHQTQRQYEFEQLIDWMLRVTAEQDLDAFLIAGDIFDTANPPNWADRLWHRFLASLRKAHPKLDIVVIGGNHDSPLRLEVTRPILRELDIHVVGGVPWLHEDGERKLDVDRLLIPLHDSEGAVQAYVIAMPFIRVSDLQLHQDDSETDPFITALDAIYREAIEAARSRQKDGQRLIGMGHAYMRGGKLSEWSERKVLVGNQHAIPVSVFPEDLDYVALGHLHLAQKVAGRDQVRYSGAPLPLSFAEADYPHQVRLVEWEADQPLTSQSLKVPKAVEFLRIPEKGFAKFEDVEKAISELPDVVDQDRQTWPYLEVRVLLESPQPDLWQQITSRLAEKAVRLLKITTEYTRSEKRVEPIISLQEVKPEQLFRQRYAQQFEDEPAAQLVSMFHQVVEEAERQL